MGSTGLKSFFSDLASIRGIVLLSVTGLFLYKLHTLYNISRDSKRKSGRCPFGFGESSAAVEARRASLASSIEAEEAKDKMADHQHTHGHSHGHEAGASAPQTEPLPVSPEALKVYFTVTDLAHCKGEEGEEKNAQGFKKSQILICVNGEVYEATSHPTGADFYGPQKHYSLFAGVDSSVALGKMKLEKEVLNNFEDMKTLGEKEQKALAEWVIKFRSKYTFVGHLKEIEGHKLDLSAYNCPDISTL